jgi:hypothetical protein
MAAKYASIDVCLSPDQLHASNPGRQLHASNPGRAAGGAPASGFAAALAALEALGGGAASRPYSTRRAPLFTHERNGA